MLQRSGPLARVVGYGDRHAGGGGVEGAEKEFERFAREQARSLMRQAYLLTGDAAEAQDLVQETMLRAWRSWPTLSSYEQPGAWCRQVLHRLAVGRWRKLVVRHRHPLAESSATPATDADHLDVVAAVRALRVPERRALVLHDIAGLSVAEIAGEMQAPEGTVRSWLTRARAQVAAQLGISSLTTAEERRS